MAKTDVELCNVALARVGNKQQIGDLNEESTEAQLCSTLYPNARDTLLSRFPWPFCTRHQVLALLTGVTRSGWQFAYQLPSDCLEPERIFNGARPGQEIGFPAGFCFPLGPNLVSFAASWGQAVEIPFAIEANDAGTGRILLTDQENAELVYTVALDKPVAFPQPFTEALQWVLAGELALPLTGKFALAQGIQQRGELEVSRAWAKALNNQQPDRLPQSQFIAVRRS